MTKFSRWANSIMESLMDKECKFLAMGIFAQGSLKRECLLKEWLILTMSEDLENTPQTRNELEISGNTMKMAHIVLAAILMEINKTYGLNSS